VYRELASHITPNGYESTCDDDWAAEDEEEVSWDTLLLDDGDDAGVDEDMESGCNI
jgi:hypothetical protein